MMGKRAESMRLKIGNMTQDKRVGKVRRKHGEKHVGKSGRKSEGRKGWEK